MAQIYIVHYGTRDTSVIPVNNAEHAAKIAAGLQRMVDILLDPSTEFLAAKDFKTGEPNNTWVHVCLITEPATIPPDPGDIEDPTTVDIQPRSQFNAHFMVKHVADEDELAGGLTAAGELEPK